MSDDDLPTRQLERLDPPAGGELRLRRALAAGPPASRWPPPMAATALASVLVVVAVAVAFRPDPQRQRIQHALQLAMSPQPEIQVERADVVAVPSINPKVRIYTVIGRPMRQKPANARPAGAS